MKHNSIPIVDLFAGPGGLGEGFSALGRSEGQECFNVYLSIEKDATAHETLELRSFFRCFSSEYVPDEYYKHLRGEISRSVLFNLYPSEAELAAQEAWRATLGEEPSENVDKRIDSSLNGGDSWVLIGGPPCQAYSTVGRSRLGGINPEDPRVYLYREYLRIIACHTPPVFVMENVKGILSSRVKGSLIFEQILKDLHRPDKAVRNLKGNGRKKLRDVSYKIFSFTKKPEYFDIFNVPEYQPQDFIIQCENYGIPQARHRVFFLGIREDLGIDSPKQLTRNQKPISVSKVLNSLPRLRSGLSKEPDSTDAWYEKIKCSTREAWFSDIRNSGDYEVSEKILETINKLSKPLENRGSRFVPSKKVVQYMQHWFFDAKLNGACNHSSRAHMVSDLHRYLYAACFAKVHNYSPILRDFPEKLLPAHKNVKKALKNTNFADRFRVQVSNRPATTVTSHIAKDGHCYIHPDPTQCRSLTVRESARLQTFPDNYFFCGNRTSQYTQVGNAVPPLIANQIAEIVFDVLQQARLT